MLKKFGVLLIVFLLDSNRLTAQTRTQNTDKLFLTCRIQITHGGFKNGHTYDGFITVIFNPPQVSYNDDPLIKSIINDIEIIWTYGGLTRRIDRLTGLYSDTGSSGPCEKISNRKF